MGARRGLLPKWRGIRSLPDVVRRERVLRPTRDQGWRPPASQSMNHALALGASCVCMLVPLVFSMGRAHKAACPNARRISVRQRRVAPGFFTSVLRDRAEAELRMKIVFL